jgi:hypothetical protein
MLKSSLALIAIASALAGTTANAAMPGRVGQCVATTISQMSSRLEGDPSSGSAVVYANDAPQVSYDVEPAVRGWRAGDRVTMCLVSLPTGCPPGDTRGAVYKVTNPRVGTSWTEADSAHSCGGA